VHPLSERVVVTAPERIRPAARLIVTTVDSAIATRLPGLAAEIAFWVLLSLPALLLSGIAVAGLVIDGTGWHEPLINRIVEVSRLALTEPTIQGAVVPVVEQLVDEGGVGVASFAFVATVWVAARAVKVVLQTISLTLNRAEPREAWKDRLLGFGITLGGLLVGLVLAPVLLAGPNFGEQLAEWIGRDLLAITTLWHIVYYPAGVVVATLAIAVLYHLGTPGRTPWRRDLPGAVFATVVWLGGSWGLRLYGSWVAAGDSAYGPLAGPIVALLWLWVSGFAVLLGAALNAQIGRQWPVPGSTVTPRPPPDAEG
jgi:membrane protein